jgi:hypothetical protein
MAASRKARCPTDGSTLVDAVQTLFGVAVAAAGRIGWGEPIDGPWRAGAARCEATHGGCHRVPGRLNAAYWICEQGSDGVDG